MADREYKVREVTLELLSTTTSERERQRMLVGEKIYTGKMLLGPSIGKSFCFYRDDGEYMHTSEVLDIQVASSDELLLTTRNSTYKLKIGKSLNE